MGQKVNAHGLRVGVIKDWDSKWYADKKNFADYLVEDNLIRIHVKKKLYASGVSKILIERAANNQVKVSVYTAKPGMVIGRSGAGMEELKAEIQKLTKKTAIVNILEVRKPELDAQLTAENIAQSLERRISFRRAMKQAIGRAMKSGAKGIKVLTAGRLGGAEIARSEKYSEGNVPLHTLRANINYGFAEANTTYGKIGVKVWMNHGEILTKGLVNSAEEVPTKGPDNKGRNDRNDRPRRPDGDRPRNNNDNRNRGPRGEIKPEEKRAVSPRTPRPATKAEAPRAEAPKVEIKEAIEE
jgi:small subunit ribosomal protein S3